MNNKKRKKYDCLPIEVIEANLKKSREGFISNIPEGMTYKEYVKKISID